MSRKAMQVVAGSVLLCMFILTGCDTNEEQSASKPSVKSSVETDRTHVGGTRKNDIAQWRNEFDKSLGSIDAVDRYRVLPLLSDSRIDPETRKGSILAALEREVVAPCKGDLPVEGASLPAHEFMALRLIRKLADSASKAELEKIFHQVDGEVKERVVLAQGFAGNREVAPELEKLLTQSEHGWVRAHAAFLLGELKVKNSVPKLKKALHDAFRIERKHYSGIFYEYPVRIKAHTSLQKMIGELDSEPLLMEPLRP